MGVSGSGKSRFAEKHFRTTEIVSSDRCRALLSDDETDQSATQDAFEMVHFIVDKRLRRGKLTVVDATSVQQWARASLLAIAQRYEAPAVAIVFDLPREVYTEQNRARIERVVEDAVLVQQAANLRESLPGLASEGFVLVYVLRSTGDVRSTTVVIEKGQMSEGVPLRD
jgi:predicted kinase